MTRTRLITVGLIALALLVWRGALFAADATEAIPTEDPGAVGSNGGAAYATEPAKMTDTVFGWVVDANGWLGNGLRGAEHRQDAVGSADLGTPLVILTDGGTVVYPVDMAVPSSPQANNDMLDPFVEQRVMVTGQVIRRGQERGIVIEEVTAAQEPKVPVAASVRESPKSQIVARVADMSCWLGKGEAGAAHAQCAQACATAGEPLVLIDDAGRLYYPATLTVPTGLVGNSVLMKYCEQKVRVSGTVIERGKERAIIIDNVALYTPGTEKRTTTEGK